MMAASARYVPATASVPTLRYSSSATKVSMTSPSGCTPEARTAATAASIAASPAFMSLLPRP